MLHCVRDEFLERKVTPAAGVLADLDSTTTPASSWLVKAEELQCFCHGFFTCRPPEMLVMDDQE